MSDADCSLNQLLNRPRPTRPDGKLYGVIVGIRRDDGRYLVIRRSQHVAAPLKIAFPGGAVEFGEQREAAAKREIGEELGLNVTIGRELWHHQSPDRPLLLWGYESQLADGASLDRLTPDPNEVAEVMFLSSKELAEHPDALPYSDEFARVLDKTQLS